MRYTAMVQSAYKEIKKKDSKMTVVLAGLGNSGAYNDSQCAGVFDGGVSSSSSNPLNYLQAIYANGGAGSFDAVGWHPYNFTNVPTATQQLLYSPCSAWSQMFFTTPSAFSIMAAHGDTAKKIWATELGTTTCIPNATYTCVSEAEQANLASQETQQCRGYAWAGNYYWYDVRDDGGGSSTSDLEQHLGAVRGLNTPPPNSPNSPKPAYDVLYHAYTYPQLVQAAGATETSASTSLTDTLSTSASAGHLLVLAASVYTGATNPITSVTDSGNNTWTKIGAFLVGGHYSDGEIWYAANANAVTQRDRPHA